MKTADLHNRIAVHLHQLRVGVNPNEQRPNIKTPFIQYLPDVQKLMELEAAKIAVEMYMATSNKVPLGVLWRNDIIAGLNSLGYSGEQIRAGLDHALNVFSEKV